MALAGHGAQGGRSSDGRRGALVPCLAAAASAAAILASLAVGGSMPTRGPAQAPAAHRPRPPVPPIEPTADLRREAERFALNALLLPLIDDETGPRWVDDPARTLD
jgi:hypothetical protein